MPDKKKNNDETGEAEADQDNNNKWSGNWQENKKTLRSHNPQDKFPPGDRCPEQVRECKTVYQPKSIWFSLHQRDEAAELRADVGRMADEDAPLTEKDYKIVAANLHHVNAALAREQRSQGYTMQMVEKSKRVATMKLGLVGPFDRNWPNDDDREHMVELFCQQLGLERRDVRDIQLRSFAKLGKHVLIELRNGSVARWAFSSFFRPYALLFSLYGYHRQIHR